MSRPGLKFGSDPNNGMNRMSLRWVRATDAVGGEEVLRPEPV
jgi:hypothetical protein